MRLLRALRPWLAVATIALSPLAFAQGAPPLPPKAAPPKGAPAKAAPPKGAPPAPLPSSKGSAPAASSAPPPLPDAAADSYRQHMDFGISFYEQKNYPAALAEFQAAYNAKPKASPLVNMALCHKAQFAYTKAIRALQTALDKHADTMDENDKKAALTEIDEMRAHLALVTFKLTPASSLVEIDGDAYPEAAQHKAVPVDPGSHAIRISSEGYAPEERTINLASGQQELTYGLRPSMGFVKIKADGPGYAIAVDQKPRAYGEWVGTLEPGSHIVELYLPGSGTPTYRVRVDIEAGKSYDIARGKGGVLVGSGQTTVALPPTTPPDRPRPPDRPVTGPFALAVVSLFVPMENPVIFRAEKPSAGPSGGLRVGYRVNTPVSFDAMFEYSNMQLHDLHYPTSSNKDPGVPAQSSRLSLEYYRMGLNMRLQTPNRIARVYGSIGGGPVYQVLQFTYGSAAPFVACIDANSTNKGVCRSPMEGWDAYFLLEGGLQFSAGRILLDLSVGTILQSTRFNQGVYSDILPIFEAGLRVGYAAW